MCTRAAILRQPPKYRSGARVPQRAVRGRTIEPSPVSELSDPSRVKAVFLRPLAGTRGVSTLRQCRRSTRCSPRCVRTRTAFRHRRRGRARSGSAPLPPQASAEAAGRGGSVECRLGQAMTTGGVKKGNTWRRLARVGLHRAGHCKGRAQLRTSNTRPQSAGPGEMD